MVVSKGNLIEIDGLQNIGGADEAVGWVEIRIKQKAELLCLIIPYILK